MNDNDYFLELDDVGYPVLQLARTHTPRPIGVGTPVAGTQSGNPWHDPGSGKFSNSPPGVAVRGGGELLATIVNAAKSAISQRAAMTGANSILGEVGENGHIKVTLFRGEQVVATLTVPAQQTPKENRSLQDHSEPEPHMGTPAGVDPGEWERRMDTVRSIAREFEDHSHGDVAEALHGRTTRPLTELEINQLRADVKRQRLADLIDWLDHSLRRQSLLTKRSRRVVRVVPPRNWVRKSLNALSDIEVKAIVDRLEAMGHARDDLVKIIPKRFDALRQDRLQSVLGGSLNTPKRGSAKSASQSSSSDDRGRSKNAKRSGKLGKSNKVS